MPILSRIFAKVGTTKLVFGIRPFRNHTHTHTNMGGRERWFVLKYREATHLEEVNAK